MAYKRNIFIINPAYQFKYCLAVLALILLGTITFPVIIYEVFEKLIEVQPLNEQMFVDARNNIFQYLLFSQFCYLGISFVICIYLSHKTAGPIYKLTQYLKSLRESDQIPPLTFRKGDYFTELPAEVNETVTHLKSCQNTDSKDQFYKYLEFISVDLNDQEKQTLEIIKEKIKSI